MLRTTLAASTLIASAAMADDAGLLVFDYSGFENPGFHADYIEAHGSSPDFAFFAEEEEAFQKLVSGFRADVAHICAGSVTKWIESGVIEAWDTARIDAWGDLNADLRGTDVTAGDQVYFLPTDYGSTATAYNPDLVPAEDAATLAIYQNAAYAGKITLPDNVDDAFALAYLATGVTDWSDVSDAEFEAAVAWLRATHTYLRTYWTDAAELAQLLATGEVAVAWAWNETYPTMAEEGRPVGFARETAEGSSLWVCGQVLLADRPGDDALVYDYVNALLSPSATDALLEDGFGQANAAAMASVSAEELEAAGLGDIAAPILAQLPMDLELRARQAEAFEMIKAGF